MESLIEAIHVITISQLIVLAILIWRSDTQRKNVYATTFFLLCVVGYLLLHNEYFTENLFVVLPLCFLAYAVPYSFWLYSKATFDDNFRWQLWMLWVLIAIEAIQFSLNFGWSYFSDNGQKLFALFCQCISFLCVILAIVEAVRGRDADLILLRLRFRSLFIFLSAAAIVITLLLEFTFTERPFPPIVELLQKSSIAVLVFYFTFSRLAFKSGFFKAPEVEVEKVNPPKLDKAIVRQLLHTIEVEKIYRTEGLTIRALAHQMNIKEYKLRQTINQHLGFKNFNEFLHSYRIQEACDLLVDPAKQDMTILEITYQLGYQSLAPFNKAFKQNTGLTPTEFRRAKVNA